MARGATPEDEQDDHSVDDPHPLGMTTLDECFLQVEAVWGIGKENYNVVFNEQEDEQGGKVTLVLGCKSTR